MNVVSRLIAIIIVLSIFSQAALTRVLDPGATGPDGYLLYRLSEELDKAGIDVIQGKASSFPSGLPPRLTSLDGFIGSKKNWGSKSPLAIAVAFSHGFLGGIFAFKTDDSESHRKTVDGCFKYYVGEEASICHFVRDWLSKPKDQRVFIAFTREDFDTAHIIARTLEREGYFTFMYLKGKADLPWTDPRMTGAVFASAGVRLVLDTPNARSSDAVQVEEACCEYLLWSPSRWKEWIEQLNLAA